MARRSAATKCAGRVLGWVCGTASLGALSLAAGSQASPLGEGLPQVGPALASDGVLFGERAGRGLRAVHLGANRERRVVFRRAAPRNRLSRWDFSLRRGGLAASATYGGFVVDLSTITERESDAIWVFARTSLFGGPLSGEFSLLSGHRRGGSGCQGPGESPGSVDLDGSLAAFPDSCGDSADVSLLDLAGGIRTVAGPVDDTYGTRVRIAGPYVGWHEPGSGIRDDKITVAHRTEGRVVLELTAKQLNVRSFEDFALQPDGKLALIYASPRLDTVKQRLGWLSIEQPHLRRLSSRALEHQVEMAGDRIAFIRFRGEQREELAVVDLEGEERVVARFGPRRQRLGDFDLDNARVTWAAARTRPPRRSWDEPKRIGPGRIFLRPVS